MSVIENNYRVRNVLYHTQTYFTVVDSLVSPTGYIEPEIFYPGYNSGIAFKSVIPVSEWESLTDNAPDEWSFIPGNINGFTNDATIWHTKLHMIATDGTNYGMGISTVRQGNTYYRTNLYCYSVDRPGEWFSIAEAITVKDTILSPVSNAYDKMPEYLYLSAVKNTDPNNEFYPYPIYVGWYFFREDLQRYYRSCNIIRSDYIVEMLNKLELTPEENPDPQPTPIPNDDPYSPGGTSWTGGGNGNFDPTSDDVEIPGLPALSATSTGFITLFNPSVTQMRNLANYMWSGLFDIDTFRKIFADPMDCILGLSIIPVDVPAGGSAEVMVGNIATGIYMTTASAQYVEVDCGSVDVSEYWGAYLDYEPYTKAELYLPYIGTHAISIDDIMGRTVTIKYHVDILSGACVAYVKCGASVLYSFIGQCASSIPITGNDWTNVINGVLSIAGSIGSMVATGGASAPTAIPQMASTGINSLKPSIEKSGSLSGTGGMLGIQTPYLILTRPRQALPERQNKFIGYPAFMTDFLGNLSGYTEVESIHLEGIQATGAELSEIETILKGGVIL